VLNENTKIDLNYWLGGRNIYVQFQETIMQTTFCVGPLVALVTCMILDLIA